MTIDIPEFYHYFETVVNGLSILFNCFLLYLIKRYSTFGVKIYKYMLTIDVILDLGLSIVALLCQLVILTSDGHLVITSNGYFGGVSPVIDSFLIIIFTSFLHTNVLWVPVQFLARYRLLCKSDTKPSKTNIFIAMTVIAYSITAIVIMSIIYQVRDEFQSVGLEVLRLNNWPILKDGRQIFVIGFERTQWRTIIGLTTWVVTSCGSVFIVIWCEKKIVNYFNEIGCPTNTNTQRMHMEFHRALLAMAICPLITMTIPIMYVCITFVWQVNPGQISALISSVSALITLVNPLTTVVCFRCYRQATLRHLSCNFITPAITPASHANSSNIIISSYTRKTDNAQEIAQQKTTRIADQQL